MTCQEAIDVMDEALEGRLAPGLRPGFDEHMSECRPCSIYYGHIRLTREALRSLSRERSTSPRRGELIEEFRRERDRGEG